MRKPFSLYLVAFVIAMAFPFIVSVSAQSPTVTKVVAVAKPKSFYGPCPAKIHFIGTIFVSHPARVEYRWERSDGSMGPREFVDVRGAGRGVTTTWELGKAGTTSRIWEKLHVLAPTGISSNEAEVEMRCQ